MIKIWIECCFAAWILDIYVCWWLGAASSTSSCSSVRAFWLVFDRCHRHHYRIYESKISNGIFTEQYSRQTFSQPSPSPATDIRAIDLPKCLWLDVWCRLCLRRADTIIVYTIQINAFCIQVGNGGVRIHFHWLLNFVCEWFVWRGTVCRAKNWNK